MLNNDEIAEKVFWSLLKSQVHTMKPAIITSVDYDNACLSATPVTTTTLTDGTVLEEQTVIDVPILIISANDGSAKLTMPIKVGDRCFILYSDRDYGELLETEGSSPIETDEIIPFGRNPLGALCCYYTQADPTVIDENNVVLQNGTSDIIIEPSGQITIDATNVIVNASGNTEVNTAGNTIVTTTGTTDIISTGAIAIESTAAVSVSAGGACTIAAAGNVSIASSSGSVAVSSSGVANMVSTGITTVTAANMNLVAGLVTVEGNFAVTGTATITGETTFAGDVTATGTVTGAEGLVSGGDVELVGSLTQVDSI